MKHIEEYELPQSFCATQGLILLILVVIISTVLAHKLDNDYWLWLSATALPVHIYFMAVVDQPRYEAYRNDYISMLNNLSTAEIVMNLESKTMSISTKETLIRYLNKHREGWALNDY